MNSKNFSMAHVLSIVTGRLFGDIELVYEILDFMTGDELFTHALPRACRECSPYLVDAFPFLAEIDASVVNRDNWEQFLNDQIAKFGNEFEVWPIHHEDHEVIDPIEEAKRMNPNIQVIPLDVTDDDEPSPYGNVNFKK